MDSKHQTKHGSLWTVTTIDISGYPEVVLCQNRDEAVNVFMMYAHMIIHTLPTVTMRVIGEDDDAALTGIHLIGLEPNADYERCLLSLVAPAIASPQEGWSPFLFGKSTEFTQIASELQATIDKFSRALSPADLQNVKRTAIYMRLSRLMAKELVQGNTTGNPAEDITSERKNRIWQAMKQVRVWINSTARVS